VSAIDAGTADVVCCAAGAGWGTGDTGGGSREEVARGARETGRGGGSCAGRTPGVAGSAGVVVEVVLACRTDECTGRPGGE